MKKLLIIIGLVFAFTAIQAQELPLQRAVPDLDFAHFDRNHLVFPGNNAMMERFFQKMELPAPFRLVHIVPRVWSACCGFSAIWRTGR